MKTQDAISALRPLSNWSKAITKLSEILDLIQEKEGLVDNSELRLANLTRKIDEAEAKWATNKKKHEEELVRLNREHTMKMADLEHSFKQKSESLDHNLNLETEGLARIKEQNLKTKNLLHDEEAVLINSIRDKKQELLALSESLHNAITGTRQFVQGTQDLARVD